MVVPVHPMHVDHEDRGFDALAEKTISAIQEFEPGALIYVVHRVEDAPLSRVFYELYAGPDARVQHELAEYFKRALVELEQYVESVRLEFPGCTKRKATLSQDW